MVLPDTAKAATALCSERPSEIVVLRGLNVEIDTLSERRVQRLCRLFAINRAELVTGQYSNMDQEIPASEIFLMLSAPQYPSTVNVDAAA